MADRLWRRVEEAERALGIARAAFDALPAEERKAFRALAKAAEKEKLIAAKTELETMPAEEFWAGFERVGQLLHLQEWKFAKTMASNPTSTPCGGIGRRRRRMICLSGRCSSSGCAAIARGIHRDQAGRGISRST